MKKSIITLAILATIILAFLILFYEDRMSDSEVWITFNEPAGSFSVQYPSEFEFVEEAAEYGINMICEKGVDWESIITTSNEVYNCMVYDVFGGVGNDNNILGVKVMKQLLKEETIASPYEPRVGVDGEMYVRQSYEVITYGSNDFIRATYLSENNSKDAYQQYLFFDDELAVLFGFGVDLSDATNNASIFKEMIASFRLTN